MLLAPDPRTLSQLIGLIYETAVDTSAWSRLLHSLGHALDTHAQAPATVGEWAASSAPGGDSLAAAGDPFWLSCLQPHLERALSIQGEWQELTQQRDALDHLLERLPLGMAMVKRDGEVLSYNKALAAIARGQQNLRLSGTALVSEPASALSEVINRVLSGLSREEVLALPGCAGAAPLSLWVTRLGQRLPAHCALVMVASRSVHALSEEGLMNLFQLTPAEARLTQQLALGQPLESVCQVLHIQPNTAKTLLKRVFAKVGVRRQAELIQAVYASPLWLAQALPAAESTAQPNHMPALWLANTEAVGMLPLPDGRVLAYSDNGPADGLPVVMMHGITGSRWQRHPDSDGLHALGVRLIIPERPGVGDSSPQPERQIRDWPRDVAALADHLRLERFGVVGFSLGASYALATAQALGERVTAVALMAPVCPVDRWTDLSHYPPRSRLHIVLARHLPQVLPPLLRLLIKDMRRNVYGYTEQAMAHYTASDRQMYENPLIRARHAASVLASVRSGETEMLREIVLSCRSWPVVLHTLTQRVDVWHGDGDVLVAASGAQQLARQLPHGHWHSVAGAGHFLVYSHWQPVLAQLAQAMRACCQAT